MKKFLLLPFLLLSISACDIREQKAVDVTQYSATEFYDTTSFNAADGDGYAFSFDGASLLISSDESGVYNAYAVDRVSGERVALTRSTTNAAFGVTYFPHDNRILYSADGGGDELSHIWVREENGTVTDLTATEKTVAQFAGWSATNSHFHVLTNERDASVFDLYTYDANTYDRVMSYQNPGGLTIADISGDGRYIILKKTHSNANSDLYAYDKTASGEPSLITPHEGNISYGSYGFTPDNKKLVYSTNEHGEWNEAWVYGLAKGDRKPFIKADWDLAYVTFSKTGAYQVSAVNADAQMAVTITDLTGGAALQFDNMPDGNISDVRFNADDTMMTFMLNSDTAPDDLYVADIKNKSVKALTRSLSEKLDPAAMVKSVVVRYESYDKTLIPSILYKPKNASATKKVPAIVVVHGGPGGQTRRGYSAMVQHLVNHGYAVLGANNRGSSGYGKTYFHMDDKRHGDVDLKDIVWGRKYLESLPWVDNSKIGIMGGSYGGYMVAAALAFEPEVFDVGVNIFGVTNWLRTLKSIPPWWGPMRQSLYDELGDPALEEDRLRRISPLFHAKNIVKPLMVVQGANDPRVLQVESDELVDAVKANGVPVEYIIFPDEGHGFKNRKNRITASDGFVAFLDKYLKNKPGL